MELVPSVNNISNFVTIAKHKANKTYFNNSEHVIFTEQYILLLRVGGGDFSWPIFDDNIYTICWWTHSTNLLDTFTWGSCSIMSQCEQRQHREIDSFSNDFKKIFIYKFDTNCYTFLWSGSARWGIDRTAHSFIDWFANNPIDIKIPSVLCG